MGGQYAEVVVFPQQLEQRIVRKIGGIEQATLLVGFAHQQSLHFEKQTRFPAQDFRDRSGGERNRRLRVSLMGSDLGEP